MSEGRSEVGQRDSEIRQNVLACLRKRERRALFVTALTAALRKAHGTSASAMEQALAALEADWTVVIRDHYCADPHLEGADLWGVVLIEASVGAGTPGGEDAQSNTRAPGQHWSRRRVTLPYLPLSSQAIPQSK